MWWSERRRVKQAELVVTECEAVVKRRDKEKRRGSEQVKHYAGEAVVSEWSSTSLQRNRTEEGEAGFHLISDLLVSFTKCSEEQICS